MKSYEIFTLYLEKNKRTSQKILANICYSKWVNVQSYFFSHADFWRSNVSFIYIFVSYLFGFYFKN